ncbi:hypothetical protein chiPu_0022921 [Chiloscyllium punctatum]|uniref:Uncharacterized protein n=1 Tax=Chiloscyllium punctatum TaxID=137246 RepID=A0A401T903_CHIPU|nr:hypothetical protein [Chiloscyllium punctatum]
MGVKKPFLFVCCWPLSGWAVAEPRCKDNGSPVEINDWEVENTCQSKRAASVLTSKKNRDQGYNYTGTLQLLGLEEGNEENVKDPVMTKGAYLSLLYLRHLRIRELQVTVH